LSVEKLQKELEIQYKWVATLREENWLLKRALKTALGYASVNIPDRISLEVPEVEQEHWADKSDRFASMRAAICKVVVEHVSKEGKPAHYDDIIDLFKRLYPRMFRATANPADTISRRVRELREEGYLTSCSPGYFQPGPKLMKNPIPNP
jgi:hypothetical protein